MQKDIPKCIFVPQKSLLRQFITSVARCNSFDEAKNKFGAN